MINDSDTNLISKLDGHSGCASYDSDFSKENPFNLAKYMQSHCPICNQTSTCKLYSNSAYEIPPSRKVVHDWSKITDDWPDELVP